ncbi:MAG: DNA cytosine methyltransferase [Burkholderiales bacterium]|nr:DNA cytosine methyltransferase [Burkholderiales bacterium]
MKKSAKKKDVLLHAPLIEDSIGVCPEQFSLRNGGFEVARHIRLRNGDIRTTTFSLPKAVGTNASQNALADAADFAYLSRKKPPAPLTTGLLVRAVDLFSGCGMMSLGLSEACRALGKRLQVSLAVELNQAALEVYKANFNPARGEAKDIAASIDGALGRPKTRAEANFLKGLGKVDILVGGPPCQGHSDLNNHTRRADPKNELYLRMARFAELANPSHIIIENVPAVVHDKSKVVQRTILALEEMGYDVDSCLVEMKKIGVPQGRRRHVVVASKSRAFSITESLALYARTQRSVGWALKDLLKVEAKSVFDSPSVATIANEARIDYLFENDLLDLPDELRPACHKAGGHSYKSVYGRLDWNLPAQTITSGFGSMGQGRFVHPKKRRTITPHEAARLQFIPDHFKWGDTGRTALAEMIGNAVPPKVSYVLALELLR